ncbi:MULTISPECIES: helix-turn-helix transcriptional regulator, partial [Rhizobium]
LQDVADAIGASKTHVYDLETGRSTNPSIELLTKLATHFRVSIADLVGDRTRDRPAAGPGGAQSRHPAARSSPYRVHTYGHSWSVNRTNRLTVVAFTNAGLEGQSPGGRFPAELTEAIYAAL